jgi:hypothetical protein
VEKRRRFIKYTLLQTLLGDEIEVPPPYMWAGNIARLRDMRNAYKILVAKPDGKRPLGRCRRRPI